MKGQSECAEHAHKFEHKWVIEFYTSNTVKVLITAPPLMLSPCILPSHKDLALRWCSKEFCPTTPPTSKRSNLKNMLREFLKIVLGDNHFQFHNQHYDQTRGVAMGTRCAPSLPTCSWPPWKRELWQAGRGPSPNSGSGSLMMSSCCGRATNRSWGCSITISTNKCHQFPSPWRAHRNRLSSWICKSPKAADSQRKRS